MPVTDKLPVSASMKLRVPYDKLGVYEDPATGNLLDGDAVADGARAAMLYDKDASQARYAKWLDGLTAAFRRGMPSMAPVDHRPSACVREVLANKLFTLSVEDEGWAFAIRLSTNKDCGNPGAQVALFPKACSALRAAALSVDASGCVLMKKSHASYRPLADLSDAEFDAIAGAVRIRANRKTNPMGGFNEPAKAAGTKKEETQ